MSLSQIWAGIRLCVHSSATPHHDTQIHTASKCQKRGREWEWMRCGVCGGRCQLDRRYFSQLNRQTRRERGSIYRLCQKYPSKVPEIQAPQVAHLTLGPSATEGAGVTETLRQTFKVPCIPYVQYASQATGESKIPYDGLMAHQKGKKVPWRNSLSGS